MSCSSLGSLIGSPLMGSVPPKMQPCYLPKFTGSADIIVETLRNALLSTDLSGIGVQSSMYHKPDPPQLPEAITGSLSLNKMPSPSHRGHRVLCAFRSRTQTRLRNPSNVHESHMHAPASAEYAVPCITCDRDLPKVWTSM